MVLTEAGFARAVFVSDVSIGTVAVTARSGSLGVDGPVSLDLEVIDRNVAIGNANLALNPSNLGQSGGQVDVRLTVFGPDNKPLPGKAVIFSTDYGSLASNGSSVFTDSGGEAGDQLSLANLPALRTMVTVTAKVAANTSTGTVTISANETPDPIMLVSPESPVAGDTVFFNGATSSDPDGHISNWLWDFGDGNSASGSQVTHGYPGAKSYVVVLTVIDNQAASASTNTLLTIGNNAAPVASFTISPLNPRINDIVFLDAGQSSDSDGSIVSYEWNMGNGSEREGVTTSYAWPGAGTFAITLRVTDNGGATATTSQQITVSGNLLPFADFVFSPTTPRVDTLVSFDASPSTDTDGSIASYDWNLGDLTETQGQFVENVYGSAGNYTVLLTVTDNEGGRDYFSQTVVVSDNTGPTAAFTFNPSSPKIGETVLFDGSTSKDDDGEITQLEWDFGDGGRGSGRIVQHVYTAADNYVVALRVSDDEGKDDLLTKVVQVSGGEVPIVDFQVAPEQLAPPGGNVLLDASGSTDEEDDLSSLSFDFDVSAPSGVQVSLGGGDAPVRQVQIEGLAIGDRVAFTVYVKDLDGNVAAATKVVEGSDTIGNATPVASLRLSPTTLQIPGGQVTLDGTESSDADHDSGLLTYNYSFQNTANLEISLSGSGPIRTATVANGLVGDSATFRLTVIDPLGEQNTVYKLLTLTEGPSNTAPTASLSTVPTAIPNPDPPGQTVAVTLDASGSTDPEQALNELAFVFYARPSSTAITVTINQEPETPYLAVAMITGIGSVDHITFVVEVSDAGGLIDEEVVTLTVSGSIP